jgi:hypothetical protein
MIISGSGTGEYFNKRFSWFGDQGAFAELAETIRTLRPHKDYEQECASSDFYSLSMKDVWREMWPIIEWDVSTTMDLPDSKAVLICTYPTGIQGGAIYDNGLWTDLLLIHPKVTRSAECRLVVWAGGSGGAKDKQYGDLYEHDFDFMKSMKIKVWDTDFATNYLAQSLAPSVSIGEKKSKHPRNRWQGFYGGTPFQG